MPLMAKGPGGANRAKARVRAKGRAKEEAKKEEVRAAAKERVKVVKVRVVR